MRLAFAILAGAMVVSRAGAQAPAPEPQQIAAAVLPLPAAMRDGAGVMGYRTAGRLEVLRPARNGMQCLADDPADDRFHVACYSTSMEPFMARGRELRAAGHIILVSTHNLGSVPEFCDHAVIINRTVLAAGPLAETFTEANLARAFGGVLRHFRFDRSTVQPHDTHRITVLTDDERPLVFGKDGHLEFTERKEHEEVVRARTLPEDER